MQNHQGSAVGTCGHRSEDLTNKLLTCTHLVSDIEAVKALACRVLRIHELRGADALRLGAALTWADGHPQGLTLHTYDRRLALAAERERFRVISAG